MSGKLEKHLDNLQEENAQGVLATRQGEIMSLTENDPGGSYVYAVILLSVPSLPRPSSDKAEDLVLVVAGKIGTDNRWGYIHVEKDTKQEVAAYLHDACKVEVGRWYFLQLTLKN
jgi:hypothetical protein